MVVRSMSKESWAKIIKVLCDACKDGRMTVAELDGILSDGAFQDQDTSENTRLGVIKELNTIIQKLNNKEI